MNKENKPDLNFEKMEAELTTLGVTADNIFNPDKAEYLKSVLEFIRKQQELIQMLIHDIIALSGEVQKQRAMTINIGSSLTATTLALEEHGVIEVAKIQEVWNRDILPSLKGAEEALKAPEAPQSNIVKLHKPKIITP